MRYPRIHLVNRLWVAETNQYDDLTLYTAAIKWCYYRNVDEGRFNLFSGKL